MNGKKAKAIRKTALGLMQAKPDEFKDEFIEHQPKPPKFRRSFQKLSGFRKAKRAAAKIY